MMHIIFFVWLVTIVQGARRSCEDTNCRIPPELAFVPKCKCFGKYIEWLRAHTHTHTHQKIPYKKSINTIHYEPIENIIANQRLLYPIQFINKQTPYYNHKIPTEITPNLILESRKLTGNEVVQIKLTDLPPNNKIKYLEYVDPIKNLGTDGNIPLYLDVNVEDSNDNGRSRLGDLYQHKIKDLTEKHIKDCFDLHVIVHMRNLGMGSQVNGNLLSNRNEIYNKLSNSELQTEISKKCDDSSTILTESFNVVKSVPYPRKSYTVIGNREYTKDQSKSQYQELLPNKIKDSGTNPNSLTVPADPGPINYNKQDLERFLELIKSESQVSLDDYATPSQFSTEINERTSMNVLSTTTQGSSLLFPNITFSSVDDATAQSSESNNDVTLLKPEIFIDVAPFSYNLTKINCCAHNSTAATTIDGMLPMMDDSGYSESKKSDHIEDNVPEHKSSEEINVHGAINDTNLNIDDPEYISSKKNRTEYFEGEYVIPKVVTTEFSNNTAISEVQGNEELSNFDFTTPSSDIAVPTQQYNFITVADQWNRNDDNLETNSKTNEDNGTDHTNVDINGKLYFKYGPEYIPAGLVQRSDGEIDVALDLLSLCEPNRNETSKLLQVLCNCIKFG